MIQEKFEYLKVNILEIDEYWLSLNFKFTINFIAHVFKFVRIFLLKYNFQCNFLYICYAN